MAGSKGSNDIDYAARGAAAIARWAQREQDAANLMYVALYACGFTGRAANLDRYRGVASYAPDEAYVARLRHDVPDSAEPTGWTVAGSDGERTYLEKNGMRAYVGAGELSSPAGVGGAATFRWSVLRTGVMPGFVARRGTSSPVHVSDLSRLYLNTRPDAAGWALGPLARRLEAAGVPYEMKVLAHPRAYVRRDSCVLYVPSELDAEVTGLVERAVEGAGRAVVRSPVPRLTARVARGVGLAHEPTDLSESGISHGQWVAGLFHDAAKVATTPGAIAERVRDSIAAAGRDPGQPHLRGTGPGG